MRDDMLKSLIERLNSVRASYGKASPDWEKRQLENAIAEAQRVDKWIEIATQEGGALDRLIGRITIECPDCKSEKKPSEIDFFSFGISWNVDCKRCGSTGRVLP